MKGPTRKIIVVAIVLIVLGAGAVIAVARNSSGNAADSSPNSTSTSQSSTTAKPAVQPTAAQVTEEVRRALTVTTKTVYCSDVVSAFGGSTIASGGVTVVKYDVGALKGTPPRKWSDAISTPYINTEPPKMRGETQATFCVDPEHGSTTASMVAHMKVDGVSVLALNPWLKQFAGNANQINDVASSYIGALNMPKSVFDKLSPAKQQAIVAKNVAWQDVAEKLGTLLNRFVLAGVAPGQSIRNYHLVAGGLEVGGLPEVGLNPNQESLPALRLELTAKGACAPLAIIGFNTGDKRPEEFAPPTCAKPPTPTTGRPHGHQPPPTHGRTPTTPSQSTTPTTQPMTTTTNHCASTGKCVAATTTPHAPITSPPTPTTAPPGVGSGPGAPSTVPTSTTQAPPVTNPNPSPPTTRPAGPPAP